MTETAKTIASLTAYNWFEADAEIIAAMDATNAANSVAWAAIRALQEKVGAKSTVRSGVRIMGFTFDPAPPIGWVLKGNIKRESFYLPAKTSKDRKALRAEIDATRGVDMGNFSDKFGGDAFIGFDDVAPTGTFYRRGPIGHKIGDTLLFGIPHGYLQGQCTKDVSSLVVVPFSRVVEMIETQTKGVA